MNNYLFLVFGYFLIFFSVIFVYFRLRKTSLTKEDNFYWLKLKKILIGLTEKLFKIIKISEKEINVLVKNLIEKILLRIKIEALKIETWATKKLEDLKQKNNL